jgi:hemerythrin-like domain-containing protein
MSTITEALVMEHAVFRAVFDQIEHVLPKAGTAQEVKLLAALVERLLNGHGEKEENLAYLAFDHVLKENGGLDRLRQDHYEIDGHFRLVHQANGLAEAQRMFNKAVAGTRWHFRHEEEVVFPFLEQVLRPETLGALGKAWMGSNSASAQSVVRNRVTT